MGSIQRRAGRPRPWKARYRAPDGKERSRSFERKIDAERWLTERERERNRGEWVDPALGKVTIAEWSERYLRTKQHLKPYTLAGYDSLLRNQVLPAFGDVPINRIQPIQVREWVADLYAAGLSASRTRQAYYLLRGMLKYAVESDYLVRNAAEGADLPRQPRREMHFLSAEELQWLAEVTRPPYGTLILLLGYGGLRWGEAISLRRSRCDLLRDRVEVTESLAEVNGKWHFGETKTYQQRMVVLPAFLKERLAAHLATEVDGDLRALVFTSPTGKPIRHGWFYTRVWKTALEEAGLPNDVRIHDLRHTSASLLISQGVHPRAVQAHLGHSSIAVTMDRYGHLFPSEFEAIGEKLEALHDRAAAQTRPKQERIAYIPRETSR
jgi:integrase